MALFDRSRGSGSHLGEGEIHAWLDGALSRDDAERIESHVAACPACREAVIEARGFIAASSRILSALDAVPSGVAPTTPRGRATRRIPPLVSWPVRAIAAVLVVGVGIAVVARRGPGRAAARAPAAISGSSVATPARLTAPSTIPSPRPSGTPSGAPSAPASQQAATPHPATPRVENAREEPRGHKQTVSAPMAPAVLVPSAVAAPAPSAATNAAMSAKAAPRAMVGGQVPTATMQSVRTMRVAPAATAAVGGAAGTADRLIAPSCDSAVRKRVTDSSAALSLAQDSVARSTGGRVAGAVPDSLARRDSAARADSAARRCP